MDIDTYHPYNAKCKGGCKCICKKCVESREEQSKMETSRWIILRHNVQSGLHVVHDFEVEFDPIPGLQEAMSRVNIDQDNILYAFVISPERKVEIRRVLPVPTTNLIEVV